MLYIFSDILYLSNSVVTLNAEIPPAFSPSFSLTLCKGCDMLLLYQSETLTFWAYLLRGVLWIFRKPNYGSMSLKKKSRKWFNLTGALTSHLNQPSSDLFKHAGLIQLKQKNPYNCYHFSWKQCYNDTNQHGSSGLEMHTHYFITVARNFKIILINSTSDSARLTTFH